MGAVSRDHLPGRAALGQTAVVPEVQPLAVPAFLGQVRPVAQATARVRHVHLRGSVRVGRVLRVVPGNEGSVAVVDAHHAVRPSVVHRIVGAPRTRLFVAQNIVKIGDYCLVVVQGDEVVVLDYRAGARGHVGLVGRPVFDARARVGVVHYALVRRVWRKCGVVLEPFVPHVDRAVRLRSGYQLTPKLIDFANFLSRKVDTYEKFQETNNTISKEKKFSLYSKTNRKSIGL